VVVALLSADSYLSDICRAEQQRALEKGKCVIPIRVQTDCDIPLYLQTRQWLDFSNPKLYPELLPRLIDSITEQSGVTVSAELLVRYNDAPALPENFVNRPELLEALRNTLFAEAANRNIALTAMQGMGGIGKTVLAQALCRDEVVQQAFPDGIFWFAIGKESQLDFPARIKGVPGLDRLLGPYDGEAACLAQYRDVLRKKAALIVVDDVWHASDVQPFIAESPRSRLLITTRDASIGAWFGAREFTANLLTEAESRQVLAKWCGRAVAELPPQATDMIHECGRLPLALAMIGAQLQNKPLLLWNSVLDHLRHGDLQKIKAQFPEPHTTLFRAVQISVDALEETARQRYLALAVLLEDMAAEPQVQQCIWGVDETEAAETAEQFISLSLAQPVWLDREIITAGVDWRTALSKSVEAPKTILLHDLQLDYVRAQWPPEDQEALDLIHGAIRLSSHVIAKDPSQFASQMVGRLLTYQGMPAIAEFTMQVAAGARTP
jgi:NB-ARC domain/TIR domain